METRAGGSRCGTSTFPEAHSFTSFMPKPGDMREGWGMAQPWENMLGRLCWPEACPLPRSKWEGDSGRTSTQDFPSLPFLHGVPLKMEFSPETAPAQAERCPWPHTWPLTLRELVGSVGSEWSSGQVSPGSRIQAVVQLLRREGLEQ